MENKKYETLDELENDIKLKKEETKIALAFAVLQGIECMDEDGQLWELVEEMMDQNPGLVSKLEFTIASVFIERGLAPRQGEDYAH